jgi:hypothetical protein
MVLFQQLKKQTRQMLVGRNGWIKNPMCSPFRHRNGGTSLGTCPFIEENPEFGMVLFQQLMKQTRQMLAGRNGWIKNPMCSPFRHRNGGTSLGTCPFIEENPEFGMVLFQQLMKQTRQMLAGRNGWIKKPGFLGVLPLGIVMGGIFRCLSL